MACAYWSRTATNPTEAREHASFQRIQFAGPWHYIQHPEGGTFAYLKDWPDAGENAPAAPQFYGAPRICGDGLIYFPPKVPVTLYDLAYSERPGDDMILANGLKVTIPVALVQHQQYRLSDAGGIGKPITEYGKLAAELLDEALAKKQLEETDQRVLRLLCLAFGQRYRPATPELLDDCQVIAREDVDPLLGQIWWGDPKALDPATDGAGSPLPCSASAAAS
jgi:hypothetical protein